MSLYSRINQPIPHPNCVVTPAGWKDKDTGELIVAMRNLVEKRREDLDQSEDQLLLEDGFFFVLEQDLGDDLAPDYILL